MQWTEAAGEHDDDAPRAVAFLDRTGMCKTGFAGSVTSQRPNKPGNMDGGVSMVPGVTEGTNLKVGCARDIFVNVRPQRVP